LPPAREVTPDGSHRSLNYQKKIHESPDNHTTKNPLSTGENAGGDTTKKTHAPKLSEGSTTRKPIKENGHSNSALFPKRQKVEKSPLQTDSKALVLPVDLGTTSQVAKRNSEIKIISSESETTDKSVEIEVKSYTPPPNASAVIEVKPNTYNGYPIDLQNYVENNLWPGYQLYPYPQETNEQINWYMGHYQQPLQPGLSYVPTEEFLHGQSFSNNPSLSSQLFYQYPVKQAIYRNPITSLSSKQNHMQEISTSLNNHILSSKPGSEHDYNSLSNYPVNPPVQSFAYDLNGPQPFPYIERQNNILPYFLPDSNEIQKPLSINTEPEMNYKPGLFKYVTKSYYLKTHPKLEWVPL
jgi:hypothetical protein